MRIFEFLQYKAFLNNFLATFPNKGRGQAQKLAKHLDVNSVVISQILKGSRHFTPEQGLLTAQFYGLDERSTDYLLLLIAKERAGNHGLVSYYNEKIKKMQSEETDLKSRVVKSKQLSDFEKAQFYSSWFYSGIRLLSSIDGFNTVDEISARFNLSRAKVRECVNFLLQTGLCVEDEKGRIRMGPAATYLEPTSPFANNHRRNWRSKAQEKMIEPSEQDLFYTGPYSLSYEDIKIIRKELMALVEKISKRVAESPCEKLACLTIDFFEVG